MASNYREVPKEFVGDPKEWNRKNAEATNLLLKGATNAVGSVTFTANSATTTLTNRLINPNSRLVLVPTTANAAAANNTWYQSSTVTGTITITHANNAQTDRTFLYALLG